MRRAAFALSIALAACAPVQPTPITLSYYQPYGISSAPPSVEEPSPYEVAGMPPEPLYEQMTDSPGDGNVWIDGYWHWDGEQWVWVTGRWEHEQDGYAYVAPYYGPASGGYVYTPGYWRPMGDKPAGWSVTQTAGNGRPPVMRPPPNYQPVIGSHGTYSPVGARPTGGRPISVPVTGRPTGTIGVNGGGASGGGGGGVILVNRPEHQSTLLPETRSPVISTPNRGSEPIRYAPYAPPPPPSSPPPREPPPPPREPPPPPRESSSSSASHAAPTHSSGEHHH